MREARTKQHEHLLLLARKGLHGLTQRQVIARLRLRCMPGKVWREFNLPQAMTRAPQFFMVNVLGVCEEQRPQRPMGRSSPDGRR